LQNLDYLLIKLVRESRQGLHVASLNRRKHIQQAGSATAFILPHFASEFKGLSMRTIISRSERKSKASGWRHNDLGVAEIEDEREVGNPGLSVVSGH
jgi:hypothetical protein